MRKRSLALLTSLLLTTLVSCTNLANETNNFSESNVHIETVSQNTHEYKVRISELESQMEELVGCILEIQSQQAVVNQENFKNSLHQIFYGEWRTTAQIYMESMPVRNATITDEQIAKDIEKLYERIKGETMQLAHDFVLLNDTDKIVDIFYRINVIPPNNSPISGFLLLMSDIGLSEGNYFVYVEILTKNSNISFLGQNFFVRDLNTLIVDYGDFFIVYERISFGENYPRPWIGYKLYND